MELKSSAFAHQSPIPRKYTREGKDVSPPLEWRDVPEGAQAFALICDDPDAPRPKPWVHWVLAGIPAAARALPEGAAQGVEGQNDFGESGYGGPMPPPGHGTHHYHFKLYALDQVVNVQPGVTKEQLEQAMSGHILGEAELLGTYER